MAKVFFAASSGAGLFVRIAEKFIGILFIFNTYAAAVPKGVLG